MSVIGFSRDEHPPSIGEHTLFLRREDIEQGAKITVNHEHFKWIAEGVVIGEVDKKYHTQTYSDSVSRGGVVKRIDRGSYKIEIQEIY